MQHVAKARVTFGSPRPVRVGADLGKVPYLITPEIAAEIEAEKKNQSHGDRDIYPLKGGVIYIPSGATGGMKEKKIDVELLASLAATLSVADRKLLLAKLALDQQTSIKPGDRDLEMWTQAVYAAMTAKIGGGDGGMGGPAVLKRLLGTTSAWGEVEDFMQRAKLTELSVTQRQSVYMMLADLLVSHSAKLTQHVKAPLTPKFVAGQIAHLPAIFDAAFPGYLASGLAVLVATRLVTGARTLESL